MGNCLETCRESQQQEGVKKQQQQQQQQHEVEAKGSGFIEEEEEAEEEEEKKDVGKGGLRVKIVLTKEELEWLMFQLKEKEKEKGRKCLEDLLEELEEGRGRTEAWKPSLESILESPEMLEMNR
ncbi:cilia- and flagella-associated protein 251-like [Telopea speciosissima]|uniref:cilia- and flagella-associated protein 251-like n=1 Tax=Telopea speciosissima TaxID=54955 RepID=UPI001CC725DA|nr:cilia- and flagella-associated protein 251-like [Telopea speciosissima]